MTLNWGPASASDKPVQAVLDIDRAQCASQPGLAEYVDRLESNYTRQVQSQCQELRTLVDAAKRGKGAPRMIDVDLSQKILDEEC